MKSENNLLGRTGRKTKLIAGVGVAALLLATDPVAAAGACSVPNASNGISQFGDLMRSVLVLAGLFVGGKTMMSSRSGGSRGKAGSRKAYLSALGLVFVGAGLPQLSGWLLGMFGSSLADVGLNCMF